EVWDAKMDALVRERHPDMWPGEPTLVLEVLYTGPDGTVASGRDHVEIRLPKQGLGGESGLESLGRTGVPARGTARPLSVKWAAPETLRAPAGPPAATTSVDEMPSVSEGGAPPAPEAKGLKEKGINPSRITALDPPAGTELGLSLSHWDGAADRTNL